MSAEGGGRCRGRKEGGGICRGRMEGGAGGGWREGDEGRKEVQGEEGGAGGGGRCRGRGGGRCRGRREGGRGQGGLMSKDLWESKIGGVGGGGVVDTQTNGTPCCSAVLTQSIDRYVKLSCTCIE